MGLHSNIWKSANITSLLTIANNSQRALSLKIWLILFFRLLAFFKGTHVYIFDKSSLHHAKENICGSLPPPPPAHLNLSNWLLALLFSPASSIIFSELKIPDFSDDCHQRQSIASLGIYFSVFPPSFCLFIISFLVYFIFHVLLSSLLSLSKF